MYKRQSISFKTDTEVLGFNAIAAFIPPVSYTHLLINHRRDDSHLRFQKSGLQKLLILCKGKFFLSQNIGQLIKKSDHQVVNLGIFFGQSCFPLFLKTPAPLRDLFTQISFFYQLIEDPGILLHRISFLPDFPDKLFHAVQKLQPDPVNLLRLSFRKDVYKRQPPWRAR